MIAREQLMEMVKRNYESKITEVTKESALQALRSGAHLEGEPLTRDDVVELLVATSYVAERELDPCADNETVAFHFGMSLARALLLEVARLMDEVTVLRLIPNLESIRTILEEEERGRCSVKVAESA